MLETLLVCNEVALLRNVLDTKRIRETGEFISFLNCFNSFFKYFVKFVYIRFVYMRSSSFTESTNPKLSLK